MGGLFLLFKDITGELDPQTRFNALIMMTRPSTVCASGACSGRTGGLNCPTAPQSLWALDLQTVKNTSDYDDVIEARLLLFTDRMLWSEIKGHITDLPAAARYRRGEMQRTDGTTLHYITQPLLDGNTLIAFADETAQRAVKARCATR